MGKGATSLTNSLYKINDKISQSSAKAPLPGVPEVPPQQNQTAAGTQQKKEIPPERLIEFNRMHHDLEIRVESMASEYQSEVKILEERLESLKNASGQMDKFRKNLEMITLPESSEQEPERYLSRQLRALELMRLETIRLSKKMDAAKGTGSGNSSDQNHGINLMEIPNGDLIKKGFAFFFPLAAALLFCTILMALAFILAWKVVI